MEIHQPKNKFITLVYLKLMIIIKTKFGEEYLKTNISFTSSNTQFYESQIFCLFTFWVFFPDKSLELISKCTQKCQYSSLYLIEKNPLCNTLNWGNWNSGFVKLGVWWAERDRPPENLKRIFHEFFERVLQIIFVV